MKMKITLEVSMPQSPEARTNSFHQDLINLRSCIDQLKQALQANHPIPKPSLTNQHPLGARERNLTKHRREPNPRSHPRHSVEVAVSADGAGRFKQLNRGI